MVAYESSSNLNHQNQITLPMRQFKTGSVGSACHLVLGCGVMKFGWLIWAQGMKN